LQSTCRTGSRQTGQRPEANAHAEPGTASRDVPLPPLPASRAEPKHRKRREDQGKHCCLADPIDRDSLRALRRLAGSVCSRIRR